MLGFDALGRLALGQINAASNAQVSITGAAGTGVARAIVAAAPIGITQAAGVGVASGTVGVSFTTFDTAGSATNATLSNGNKTATSSAGVGNNGGARSIADKIAGLHYFEITFTTLASSIQNSCGLVSSAGTYTNMHTNGTNCCVVIANTGAIFTNNTLSGAPLFGALVQGDIFGFAINLTTRKAWIRRNGGNWNNAVGNDPVTAVGGVTIGAGAFAPAVAFGPSHAAGDAFTANFGATAFSGAVPSGFNAGWFESGIVPAVSVPVPGAAFDPFFSSVKLLLGFEGTNGSTGAPGLTDESPAVHGTATSGISSTIDTSQFKFGTSSYRLHPTVFNSLFYNDSADWQLSSANSDQFTIEGYTRFNTLGTPRALLSQWAFSGTGNNSWKLWSNSSSTELDFTFSTDGTAETTISTSGAGLATGAFIAWAVDKDSSGKIRIYVDGVMKGSATPANSAFFNSTFALWIMSLVSAGSQADGWIDELRITKGVARYASDGGYTVATSAFPRNAAGTSATGTAGSISGVDTVGITQAAGTGVARTATAQAAKNVTGVAGVGTAGSLALRYVTFSGAAGIGIAGSVFGGTPAFLAGVAGIGLAGIISGISTGFGFPGCSGTGLAGAITVAFSGGGTSIQLIENRRRDPRRKPGLEPIEKRFDPPAPIEVPKLPLPPFSDAPKIAPEITEPGELRELVPRGLLSLQEEIFNAQDSSDIEKFLRGLDQDDQDAADIADVLALLDD